MRTLSLLLATLVLGMTPLMVAAEKAPDTAPKDKADTAKAEVPDGASENAIDIVISGLPTRGYIVLPPTDTEFKFKLADINKIITFRWAALEEYERKRVQKLYGMIVEDGRVVYGEEIEGVRLTLSTGKTIEGLPIPDRDRSGMRALRTATVPLILVPISEIKSEVTYKAHEGDFFSSDEIYKRKMLEKPPESAADQLAMARWCAGIELYGKAIEHLEQAKILDPRTEERNQDFRAELYQRYANQQANDIFQFMVREMRGGDFLSALDHLEQLDRSFKNSDLKSRWDALRPAIIAGANLEVNKRIVQMSYRIAMDLVQNKLFTKLRIDEKGNIVPSIPGKQVTTKQGFSYKGILVGIGGNPIESGVDDPYEKADPSAKAVMPNAGAKSGSSEDILLKMADTTLTIPGKDVLSITDVDLSVAPKTADPSFDELKEYVQGADGLKADMLRKISKVVKKPVAEVQKIFENRLAKDAQYDNGKVVISPNYASFHDAEYGIGSWLRPGAPKPMKYIQYDKNPSQSNQNRNRNNGGGRYGGQQQNNLQLQAQKEEETAEETDDPAIWWKAQNSAVKLKIMRAWAAEKVFKTYNTNNVSCPTCANKGIIGQTAAGGNEAVQRCPTCRGIGVLYKIIYH